MLPTYDHRTLSLPLNIPSYISGDSLLSPGSHSRFHAAFGKFRGGILPLHSSSMRQRNSPQGALSCSGDLEGLGHWGRALHCGRTPWFIQAPLLLFRLSLSSHPRFYFYNCHDIFSFCLTTWSPFLGYHRIPHFISFLIIFH
jgi:hypothetical protein